MPTVYEEPRCLLRGLPNTSEDVNAVRVSSRTKAIESIRLNMPITSSGDRGSINVWIDDDLNWRCEFMRHRITVSRIEPKRKAEIYEWLREWFPEMKSGE